MYSGYGIAFDGEGTCSFDSDYTKNVKTLGVDNSSSSHADNHKKKIFVEGEELPYGINWIFGSPEKKFSIIFSKVKTRICLSWNYNKDNNYLFVNGK